MKFKYLLFTAALILLFQFGAKAQMEVQKDFSGRVYYDSAETQLKEAYEYKLRYTMLIHPKTNEPVLEEVAEVKNGLYIRYREDGTMECKGFYRNDVACGHWEYYDNKENKVREEIIPGECFLNGNK